MKRFRDEHPPRCNPVTGTLRIAMEMTSRPGEQRFYAELLTLLGAPQRPRADIAQTEQAALSSHSHEYEIVRSRRLNSGISETAAEAAQSTLSHFPVPLRSGQTRRLGRPAHWR
nr:TniB family NTP-binding protein [Mesorhizobium sp.]